MNNQDCKDCKINLSIDEFEHTDTSKKYRRKVCRKCIYAKRKAYQKKYYKEHYVSKKKLKLQNALPE